ncbi:Thioredoxin domain-containing protein [Hirschfeldia incana]|nr:Thioredoxin domain-containing protein [Hirschfeldia incana]
MGMALSNMLGGGETDEGNESEHRGLTKLSSSAQWQLHFNRLKDSNQLLVIDFYASWCGPCKFIEPAVIAMAVNKFTDVSFVKVDVDELPDVAKEFNVDAMPTFVLVKNGKEVDRIVGAKKDELEEKVTKHRASS